MKCQPIFDKNKKKKKKKKKKIYIYIKFLSAEYAQRVVNVNTSYCEFKYMNIKM